MRLFVVSMQFPKWLFAQDFPSVNRDGGVGWGREAICSGIVFQLHDQITAEQNGGSPTESSCLVLPAHSLRPGCHVETHMQFSKPGQEKEGLELEGGRGQKAREWTVYFHSSPTCCQRAVNVLKERDHLVFEFKKRNLEGNPLPYNFGDACL